MSQKANPCPFCAADSDFVTITTEKDGRPDIFKSYAECENCGCLGPTSWAEGESEAFDLAVYQWNERSAP
jgi:uncharacterized Zn finger protein